MLIYFVSFGFHILFANCTLIDRIHEYTLLYLEIILNHFSPQLFICGYRKLFIVEFNGMNEK